MRERWKLVALAAVTIAAGLATRRFPSAVPRVAAEYGGDVLWATLVFWLLAFVRPAARGTVLAVVAAAIALVVELSQLLSPAWLVALRNNRVGALVLGQGFLVSDLACYAVGVLFAWWLDRRGVSGLRS